MRILFVTANRVGDAVLSTGLLMHLARLYPDARITIAAGPAAGSLFRNAPCLEHLIIVEKKPFEAHWFSLWRACLFQNWNIIVDLRRSALSYFLRSNSRYIIPKTSRQMHRVELIASTLRLRHSPPSPVLWPDEVQDIMSPNVPIIGVAPAANWIGKQWRAERFLKLVLNLTSNDGLFPGAVTAIFASADERPQVLPILEALPKDKKIDLVGIGDLATVGGHLQKCRFFIGNDSGLMHMAAAAGIPTLGLFGPSRTEHYAPWGKNCAYVRTNQSYDQLISAPGYNHRTTGTLMDGLSVSKVYDAAKQLWQSVKQNTK